MLAISSDASPTFTAPDVAAAVERLEGEPCTPRRVRYLLCDHPPAHVGAARRRTRPYGLLDVALMRLAVRLEAQGVSAWVVRVVLAYCGDEIREAWRARTPVALVVRGVTGTIVPAASGSDAPRVLLRSVWVGDVAEATAAGGLNGIPGRS